MKRKNFTLLELIVVIAVIGILTSILLPSLKKSHYHAKLALCLSNQKQMALATQTYIIENSYRFPYAKFKGADASTGRFWFGKKGGSKKFKVDVKQRLVNKYLGYTKNSDKPVTSICPVPNKPSAIYNGNGSDYMGAARKEHKDDLDTKQGSVFMAEA